jgi:AraC-like DNA-binding protein
MDILEQTSIQSILFLILYGVTGAMPLFAAFYLLFCRGNAFAPDVTPPVRLRRWAASFFAVAALGHVWWLLFYIYSRDLHSASYVVVAVFDCVALLTTIAGTLLAMLQDRRRPVWPAFAAMIPCVVLGVLQILYPDVPFMSIATIYILSIYVLFSVYMVFAVRQYGRWLNDNYADLENNNVWLSQMVILVCLLLLTLYEFVDTDTIYILHVIELVLFGLLLWRVETLPNLETNPQQTLPQPLPTREGSDYPQGRDSTEELSTPLPHREVQGESLEQLLAEHCVATHLYLRHNLSLQDLAQEVGTNRYYLSQYFSRQGITYNTYINNLRINHFVSRYEETVAVGQSVGVKQLVHESGFSSYRTFSRAFTQRMGRSVTAWMEQSAE